jgi:hypothetical protein
VWDEDSFNLIWPSIKQPVPSFIKLNTNSHSIETDHKIREVTAKLET